MKFCHLGLFVFTLVNVASAQDGVLLKHDPSYVKGKTFQSETTSNTEQTLTIAGMALETGSSTFAITGSEVIDDAEGAAQIAHTFEVFQIHLNLPGGIEVSYDKASGQEPPAGNGPLETMQQYFKILSHANWVTTIGPDAKATKVEFQGDSATNVPEMFKAEMSPERWLKETNREIDRLPSKVVNPGDTWTRNSEAELGSGQKFHLSTEYKYVGREEHKGKPMDHVTITTKTVVYEIGPESTLPLQVKKSDLKIDESAGDLWFDPELRHAVETSHSLHITGDLILVINGQELPSKLDLKMDNTNVVKK
ncbi:MAG: hypothetical protein KDA80_17205 [Planctomycetaceae bacterium]|nr:hypothetical protein [Planctomycetaceae bacterium]